MTDSDDGAEAGAPASCRRAPTTMKNTNNQLGHGEYDRQTAGCALPAARWQLRPPLSAACHACNGLGTMREVWVHDKWNVGDYDAADVAYTVAADNVAAAAVAASVNTPFYHHHPWLCKRPAPALCTLGLLPVAVSARIARYHVAVTLGYNLKCSLSRHLGRLVLVACLHCIYDILYVVTIHRYYTS